MDHRRGIVVMACGLLAALAAAAVPAAGPALEERAAQIGRLWSSQLPLKETSAITMTEMTVKGPRLTAKHVVTGRVGDDSKAEAFRNGVGKAMCSDFDAMTAFVADGGTIEHVYVFTDRTVTFVLTAQNCRPSVKQITRAYLQELAGTLKLPVKLVENVSLVSVKVGEGLDLIYVIQDGSLPVDQVRRIAVNPAARASVEASDRTSRCADPGTRALVLGGATVVFRRVSGDMVLSEARINKETCGLK